MTLQKWNYKTRAYEPFSVPDSFRCVTWSDDMSEVINCPRCGRQIHYGDAYTSRQIHTDMGFGYMVCSLCYELEFEEEKAAKASQNKEETP